MDELCSESICFGSVGHLRINSIGNSHSIYVNLEAGHGELPRSAKLTQSERSLLTASARVRSILLAHVAVSRFPRLSCTYVWKRLMIADQHLVLTRQSF